MAFLGRLWTWVGRATSCPQIPSAIIGVIGVCLEVVWDTYCLVKESTSHCTERNSFPQTPDFCFFLCQLRLLRKGISPCISPPPSPLHPPQKKLHWPLLSIASICEQLSLLQMEMRPKIATNGAMPLNADVLCSSPRVHMPDQINFNPSADRTDSSFTNSPLQQFVLSQGPGNNCMSTRGK